MSHSLRVHVREHITNLQIGLSLELTLSKGMKVQLAKRNIFSMKSCAENYRFLNCCSEKNTHANVFKLALPGVTLWYGSQTSLHLEFQCNLGMRFTVFLR